MLNFEIILPVYLGNLHFDVAIVRSEVVIKTTVIVSAALVIPLIVLLLATGVAVITIIP